MAWGFQGSALTHGACFGAQWLPFSSERAFPSFPGPWPTLLMLPTGTVAAAVSHSAMKVLLAGPDGGKGLVLEPARRCLLVGVVGTRLLHRSQPSLEMLSR